MKVIIYTRQSKHRDESVTHELQENACQSFAKSRGWEVVRVLNERGVSGKTIAKRKEFQTALKMIEDKEAEGLLVWRWSRFARNTLDGLITLKSIEEEAKGQVHCALEQIDRSAMGKFSLTMMLGMAELESNIKGEQWKEALNLRLSKGLPPSGKPHFGYSKIGKEGYVQNTDADTLREAYERYTKGEGARTICADFSSRGLTSAGPAGWAPRGLFDLLDKSFYAGFINYEGQDFPGAHEPILSPAQWAAYRKAREARKTQEKPRNPKWMLAGLAVCGRCGAKMVSNMVRGVPSLACSTYNARGKDACKGVFRKRVQVEMGVWWWLGSHYEEWASIMPTDEEGRIAAEKAVADAQEAQDAAQGRVDDLLLRAVRMGLSDALIEGPLKKLQAELKSASEHTQLSLAELGAYQPASDIDEQISQGALLMGYSKDPEAPVSEEATARFREALSKVIEKVVVLPASTATARDPQRNHRKEIMVVPK